MGDKEYYEGFNSGLRGETRLEYEMSDDELRGYRAGRYDYDKSLSSNNYQTSSAPIVVDPGKNMDRIKRMGKVYTNMFMFFAILVWVSLILGIVIGQFYNAKIGWKLLAVCGISICVCAVMTFAPAVFEFIREPLLIIRELIMMILNIIIRFIKLFKK